VIHDPERDFWVVDDTAKKNETSKMASGIKVPSGSWGRLTWWAVIFLNIRSDQYPVESLTVMFKIKAEGLV
jgi:hypothetical protein